MKDKNSISSARVHQIISLIDLTNLNNDCDQAAIKSLCAQATTPAGNVAAVCIWPEFVSYAKQCLGPNSPIQIATVVNFPSGDEPIDVVCTMIKSAIIDGATEIDYVLPYRALINGDTNHVVSSLQAVRACISDSVCLKVILETGELNSDELIQFAASTAIEQGADFIKTSTGKAPVNATIQAATIMLNVIDQANKDIGFKAAGGIKSVPEANDYLRLSEERFGPNWADSTHFRFGASSLLQDALRTLDYSGSSSSAKDLNTPNTPCIATVKGCTLIS